MTWRRAAGLGIAILLSVTGIAVAQAPVPATPGQEVPMSIPNGYTIHQSEDVGGRVAGIKGGGAMYDTMVNLQSGPRMLDSTFEMKALPDHPELLVDSLHAISSGFGGDPNDFAKLDFSKGNVYEFSGIFRRDRQYFDYGLLGNPNIQPGQLVGSTANGGTTLAWPQWNQSSVMFNSVRRMLDTNVTLFPVSKVTVRFGYSQNIFQGPSLSPGESVGKYNALLQEMERNGTDDFTFGVDWKPLKQTRLSFEEQISHYKANSWFTMAPSEFLAQEVDGTPVALGDWDSQTAYSSSACNSQMTGNLLSAPTVAGQKPVINAACSVVTSYLRSQPTRFLYPTEMIRLQSASIKNVSMNGDFRYTSANMNLPNYYENFAGLDGYVTSINFTGNASAKRQVVAADYGIVWQMTQIFSLGDQIDFSDVHQPGTSDITDGIEQTEETTGAGYGTINYSGQLCNASTASATNTACKTAPTTTVEGSPNGVPSPAYFGQRIFTNDLTGMLDAGARTTLTLTYRYRTHIIAENAYAAASGSTPADLGGNPGNVPLAVGADTNGIVTINENGGIFGIAERVTNNWSINGSVEALYADNAFTPVAPRQTRHYRVHTMYRPKPWATLSGAFNDLERHNNTNANALIGATYVEPLDHVDHSRIVSLGADLMPTERYGIDFNYAYSDVYAATNICYLNGATATLPGAATVTSSGAAAVCPGAYARGSTTNLDEWIAKDFMDAPTQFGSVAFNYAPAPKVRTDIGYRVNSVNGTRFFNDARDVNGSLVSTYQTPFVNFAYTLHPGLIWKAEYNFYGYGEGGPSGAPLCSTVGTNLTASTPVVACSSLPYSTGMTEPSSGLTAPRNFHANNLTLAMHYEF